MPPLPTTNKTTMKQQTAMMEHIEWLQEVIDISHSQNVPPNVIKALEYVIEGAKAKLQMEKEQIVDAWMDGMEGILHKIAAEKYYNETYGK